MAEENPLIEVKKYKQPINNTRQQYLAESENLILGRHGFIFNGLPTTKERFEHKLKTKKNFFHENYRDKKRLPRLNSIEKLDTNSILDYKNIKNRREKNKLQNNSPIKIQNISQPMLRFKNRTDFERICDTLQHYAGKEELISLNKMRARHVHSIDFPKGITY